MATSVLSFNRKRTYGSSPQMERNSSPNPNYHIDGDVHDGETNNYSSIDISDLMTNIAHDEDDRCSDVQSIDVAALIADDPIEKQSDDQSMDLSDLIACGTSDVDDKDEKQSYQLEDDNGDKDFDDEGNSSYESVHDCDDDNSGIHKPRTSGRKKKIYQESEEQNSVSHGENYVLKDNLSEHSTDLHDENVKEDEVARPIPELTSKDNNKSTMVKSKNKGSKSRIDGDELLKAVDHLFFNEIKDTSSVTVGDVTQSLQNKFQMKFDKKTKKILRERLVELVSRNTSNSASNSDNESGDEDIDENGSEIDEENENLEQKRKSKRRQKSTRVPAHLKIHHEMRRKKQLAEAKIRNEEMQAEKLQRVTEEDRIRAELIAKKLQTDSDELRLQRLGDRLNLLQRLDQKRLEILRVDDKKDHIAKQISDEESEEESDDGELEIIGDNRNNLSSFSIKSRPQPTSISSRSVFDLLDIKNLSKPSTNSKATHKAVDPRSALRNLLVKKKLQTGNEWLARELGYENTDDHIKECQEVESVKRQLMLKKEEERCRQAQSRFHDLNSFIQESADIKDDVALNDGDVKERPRTLVGFDDTFDSDDEDEELALAKKVEMERAINNDIDSTAADDDNDTEMSDHDSDNDESKSPVDPNAGENSPDINGFDHPTENIHNDVDLDQAPRHIPSNQNMDIDESYEDKIDNIIHNENETIESKSPSPADEKSLSDSEAEMDALSSSDKAEFNAQRKNKNAGWKALLERESQLYKKTKALQKNKDGLVELEAEEEEEDEEVAGLEDFGFTVKSKKNGDEDEEQVEADDDDFEDIVDELSDNEGDEEAGEASRRLQALNDEKLAHKEMIRRIRDGYDGRRGGITGGVGGARGNYRIDQLVAAENKEDAKRLGLLNDHEIDSDDEGEGKNKKDDDNEVDDENMLLDKMLKERYLSRPSLPDENFSDADEDSDDERTVDENTGAVVDEEELQQERLAKRFAKRARMARLLETYNDDSEFSQSRLLDEDHDLRKELKSIKNVHSTNRRQLSYSSTTSNSSSNLMRRNSSMSGGVETNISDNLGNKTSSSKSSFPSLLSARNKLLNSKKRKIGFFANNSQNNTRSQSVSSSNSQTSKGVSFGHVVFEMKPEAQLTRSVSINTSASLLKKSDSLPSKLSISESKSKKSSLWNQVGTNRFRSRTT